MAEFISVEKAVADLKENFEKLSEKEINAGISSAINRTLQMARTEANRQVRSKYKIPRSDLDNAFKITKPTPSNQTGELQASSKGINLSHFQPNFSFTKKSKTSYNKAGVGVTRLLKKDSKAFGTGVQVTIADKEITIPYAFMIAGKMPVFARGKYESGGNYSFIQRHARVNSQGPDTPITALVNISVYSSTVNERVMPALQSKIDVDFNKRLEHELQYRLDKMNKGEHE